MNRDDGFSLLEVLVATTLILVAMVALATMALTALRAVDRNGERTTAVTLAQSRLEWLRSRPHASLEDGSTVDHPGGAFSGYTTTTDIDAGTPRPGLARITVTVRTPSGQTVRLATLVGG